MNKIGTGSNGGKRPRVALESTIHAFGLPYPKNVELGWMLARAIARTGADAKTLAVIDGQIRVGLDDHELDQISKGGDVKKLNASDLGPAIALGHTGATTVSATCALAAGAGISVFSDRRDWEEVSREVPSERLMRAKICRR